MNLEKLKTDLWEAADNLRTNSKLTAAQYAIYLPPSTWHERLLARNTACASRTRPGRQQVTQFRQARDLLPRLISGQLRL